MGRRGTTRRRVLIAAGALGAAAPLAGCTAGSGEDTGPSAEERAEDTLRRRSAAVSTALLSRYDAVAAAHPGLADRLAPLRAEAAAHTAALGPEGTRPPASPSSSPSVSGSRAPATQAGPSGSPGAPVPADPAAALKDLAALATTTADTHARALGAAAPEYARLLASVAAASAAHACLLTAAKPGTAS
ncbi:hypothetical protein [Streptomyces lichenis]|uniref:Lipoprotein n=1 Tax=Streptomyces lichenis TaxID=2306967 RepID=A0ABT0IGK4_9ACTN|nr:hypothetical protein [Streptomyces lichenis]MCK8680387.1 hypothetical protein [Streptomyces lichenis]